MLTEIGYVPYTCLFKQDLRFSSKSFLSPEDFWVFAEYASSMRSGKLHSSINSVFLLLLFSPLSKTPCLPPRAAGYRLGLQCVKTSSESVTKWDISLLALLHWEHTQCYLWPEYLVKQFLKVFLKNKTK